MTASLWKQAVAIGILAVALAAPSASAHHEGPSPTWTARAFVGLADGNQAEFYASGSEATVKVFAPGKGPCTGDGTNDSVVREDVPLVRFHFVGEVDMSHCEGLGVLDVDVLIEGTDSPSHSGYPWIEFWCTRPYDFLPPYHLGFHEARIVRSAGASGHIGAEISWVDSAELRTVSASVSFDCALLPRVNID